MDYKDYNFGNLQYPCSCTKTVNDTGHRNESTLFSCVLSVSEKDLSYDGEIINLVHPINYDFPPPKN